MAKQFKSGSILPADAKFYPLSLTRDGFELTTETLNKNYFPLPKSKNRLKGVWAACKAFERELAKVAVTFPAENTRYLYIHVDPGEMQVYCDCGMPEGLLCKHAYYGLRDLMYYRDSFDFSDFYWPGYVGERSDKNKFLDIVVHNSFIVIKPKKNYGNLFRPGIGFDNAEKIILEKQPELPLPRQPQGRALTLGYFIVYKRRGMPRFHFPMLLPYLGVTDKQGKRILQFKSFVTEMASAEMLYTSRQTKLNDICHQMFTLVNSIQAAPEKDGSSNKVLKAKLLSRWHEAFSLGLAAETFLHTYLSEGFKSLTKKPIKTLARECRLSDLSPALSFLLMDKGDHYLLQAVTHEGKQSAEAKSPKIPFFITGSINILHPVATVQDDDLLNWFDNYNNCLTILKSHFIPFHDQFLKRLSECYPVMYLAYRSKEMVVYDYETIVRI